MTTGDILRVCEERGIDVRVEGGRLLAGPQERLDGETLELIQEHRAELKNVLAGERRAPPTNLDALRRLCPLMWRDLKTADGRRGLLWALSPYGAVVSFGPGEPFYTLDPCEVEPVHAPSAQGEN